MATLKHVVPGEPVASPSAAIHNAMVDAALDYQQRRASQHGRPQISGSNHGVVLVRNDSGYDCARNAVLGIDEPVITPTDNLDEFKNRPAFSCITPTVADHTGKFMLLLEPLKNGAIGRGLLSGVCPVQIDVTDAGHEFADVKDDDREVLASGATGMAQILWKESGTGTKWAVVRISAAPAETIAISRFELKTSLAPATGYATAYACDEDWDRIVNDAEADPVTYVEFEVYDELGTRRGRAKGHLSSPDDNGSRGYAIWSAAANHWAILEMQPHALKCRATCTDDVTADTTNAPLEDVVVKQPTGGLLLENITYAANVFKWEFDDDSLVDIEWNEDGGCWEVVSAMCPGTSQSS